MKLFLLPALAVFLFNLHSALASAPAQPTFRPGNWMNEGKNCLVLASLPEFTLEKVQGVDHLLVYSPTPTVALVYNLEAFNKSDAIALKKKRDSGTPVLTAEIVREVLGASRVKFHSRSKYRAPRSSSLSYFENLSMASFGDRPALIGKLPCLKRPTIAALPAAAAAPVEGVGPAHAAMDDAVELKAITETQGLISDNKGAKKKTSFRSYGACGGCSEDPSDL